ncbi:MAG: Rhodanese domain protein [Microgenomates group bacterium GW2011_GWC1_41_8]|uniref:Rhodanese domain protein n=2 Tax=Candidatus Roizmaniibacteriota TaxID=1752723 RepID=A0A0G0T451_9BACT|nr:MAG: Rhodanese domain protein [Candidatus Roizmanbacteria bacterium GW2011_GWB1_40_7]KKR94091.1 MAG: Rhodanese domain protein [Candidatus Roizmanbacteria bacterium GW2011_GWA1_41_13]KKS23586.1 MAG: Rhodanese domain protein [Microgenomates group bacterium GW2011_GWC1_41_8]
MALFPGHKQEEQVVVRNYKIAAALFITLVLFSVFLFTRQNKNDITHEQTSSIEQVDSSRFSELAKQENAFLLDVHIPEQTHIPGTDAFIPYNEIEKHTDQLPSDKTTPILVYCRSGNMSRQASETLASLGYTTIYDLEGGTDLYKQQVEIIVITPETQDLGTVIYGDVAKTEFTLTNFTPDPVEITNVSTSCGCTQAEVEKKSLAPYESTRVNVSFDPAVHKDDTDLGDLTRTIYIETNNSNFQKVTAEITAMVVKN